MKYKGSKKKMGMKKKMSGGKKMGGIHSKKMKKGYYGMTGKMKMKKDYY